MDTPPQPHPPPDPPPTAVTLHYRTAEKLPPGSPSLGSVIVICVVYGILAVILFALGVLLMKFVFERSSATDQLLGFLVVVAIFFGLGSVLIYWIWWYVRAISSRSIESRHK